MLNIKHILFPVDFSERCCAAAPYVESMARQYGAKITLFAVSDAVCYAAMGEPGGPVVVNTELVLDDLQARLDSALSGRFQGLRVERVADLGDPALLIAGFAAEHNVDLIMMPTHGYGVFRQLLLGSVTAKVLHDAACPVWTAAHSPDARAQTPLPYRSILCALGGGPEAPALLKWAGDFASGAGAELRIVHVLPEFAGYAEDGAKERMLDRAKANLDELELGLGFRTPATVVFGRVAESVCHEAAQRSSDLLIIGRGAIVEKPARLRTNAYAIIRQSPCPVLSV